MQSRSVMLCIASTRAEFAGQIEDARALSRQAWNCAQDDGQRCVAAHYLARYQPTPGERLYWDLVALGLAEALDEDQAASYLPSLYLSLGLSCEQAGYPSQAQKYYSLAAGLGLPHQLAR